MKKLTFLFVIAAVMSLNIVSAQDTWVQKANFGGIPRYDAVGFSIGNKGYVGTGYNNVYPFEQKDFWEYDPALDSWTQKSDFGGLGREGAVGFSINGKGYIGTGWFYWGKYKDFWEYNPIDNTWTKKADFGGDVRSFATGFSINGKGYIGTGYSNNGFVNDFWEYDPIADAWMQKADFGGIARRYAVGFSIGNKGYIGTGYNFSDLSDFWEYDPLNDSWTQKANFAGSPREYACGFSIGNKGYLGTGEHWNEILKDFWEYDPAIDTWTEKTNFGGTGRWYAVGISIDNKGYLGSGWDSGSDNLPHDFWEYIPDTALCAVPAIFSVADITSSSVKLKWSSVAGAAKYKLRYKVAGTNDEIILNPVAHHKILSGLLPSTTYVWQVKTYCKVDSPNILSDWSSKQEFTTLPYRLSEEPSPQPSFQLYPNPAEDHASIRFTLPQSSHITIKVYDASGKEMKSVLEEVAEQGTHTLPLNLKEFPSGIYFVKMISDFGTETQKLMVQ